MPKFMNATKVITGVNTRWSYANVWDPKSINGGAPKYSVSLIIPKSDTATVEKIKAAIQAAYEDGESKLKGNGKTVPALSVLKTPLRDGDLERPDDEAYGTKSGRVIDTHMRDSTHDFPVLQNGTAAHALHYPQNCYLTKIFPLTIITYNSALHILKFDFRSLSSFLRSEHHQRQPYWKKHLFANNYYIFLSIIPLNLKTDHF